MLKIHTIDGETLRIDMADEEQAKRLLGQLRTHKFQNAITGVSLVETHTVRARCRCGERPTSQIGVQYSVSRPQAFRSVEYELEYVSVDGGAKGGERVVLYTDDVCLTMMAHRSQPSARVTLNKVGKRRFKP